jgi:RHS repeat-associated protein
VTDVPWTQSSTTLANLAYGYNLAGSRTYRNDVAAGGNFDELYGYDGIQRLLAFNRGTLAGGDAALSSLTLEQSWILDATGNWNNFSNLDLVTSGNSLVQQRTSNTANEIVNIAATVNTPPWATPAYDRNGNMTSIPKPAPPSTTSFPAVFDAWNRLAALTGTATYGYDGFHRRVSMVPASGSTRWFVNSKDWQVLEEYLGTSVDRRYVWGIRYIDDLVLRDWSNAGTLNVRHFALQDANWNVVAICNPSGTVQERYAYTAYGVCEFLNASFGSLSGSAYDWTVLYTGRVLDLESGLYHYRMRYYHPLLGVFVTRDPIGAFGGGNLYCYCEDRPIGSFDPFGRLVSPGVTSIDAAINKCLQEGTPALQIECLNALIEIYKFEYNVSRLQQMVQNLRQTMKQNAPVPQPVQPNPCPEPALPPPSAATQPPPTMSPQPLPAVRPTLPPVHVQKPAEAKKKSCVSDPKFKDWFPCKDFRFIGDTLRPTRDRCVASAGKGVNVKNSYSAKQCGAGKGVHFNLYREHDVEKGAGSCRCCNCCDDSDGTPKKRVGCQYKPPH